jgi:hypothetical protein
MRKRPNDSNETRFYLEDDDMDLGVTIGHIRENRFEPELTFWSIQRSFRVVAIVATAKPASS